MRHVRIVKAHCRMLQLFLSCYLLLFQLRGARFHKNNKSFHKGSAHENHADSFPQVNYNRDVPFIWVGGVPRSGTSLATALLNIKSNITCGETNKLIPIMLDLHKKAMSSISEASRLHEAKVTNRVLNDALGAYILSIVTRHAKERPVQLCNKDVLIMKHIPKLLELFPNSKFLLLIRDGRATCHSIVSRKVALEKFDFHSFKGCLTHWNKIVQHLFSMCLQVNPLSSHFREKAHNSLQVTTPGCLKKKPQTQVATQQNCNMYFL